MSTGSNIEWTEATWQPVAGCTRVSAGCDHCYAVAMTHRLEKMGQGKYAGLTVLNNLGDRHFNGQVRCVEEALDVPLKWKKPRRIFVNSMSDLFHRDVPFEFIDKVFAVMALCPQHTFQVLTKRPERMAEYFARPWADMHEHSTAIWWDKFRREHGDAPWPHDANPWPLPNVWLGTSCEDQAAADARIPHLLRCPAAVRFISAEPLLGEIDLKEHLGAADAFDLDREVASIMADLKAGRGGVSDAIVGLGIDWVIVGGESGGGARPCNVEWIRSIVQQCQAAGVACFVKQLGRFPLDFHALEWPNGDFKEGGHPRLFDTKGGDPAEWPEDLRVREWPAQKVGAAS